jgi:UDP-N-acetylmuramoylalanine--D-glutamate ligase
MGLGLFGGGAGAARYLVHKGWDVQVTDLRSEETLAPSLKQLEGLTLNLRLGGHEEADFREADLVVVNPAVGPDNRFLQIARESGARITSELELFLEAVPSRLVLITGTAGKSSSASFLVTLLEASGQRAHLGGNIGRSLLGELATLGAEDIVCLEVSSYQLEALELKAHPRVELVAITNVSGDHLERHGSRAEYARAKGRILGLGAEDATAVLPRDLQTQAAFATTLRTLDHPGSGSDGAQLELDRGPVSMDRLPLLPDFQRANVRLAVLLGSCMGLTHEQLEEGLAHLQPPPHRAEELGHFGGIRIVDNGISTTPEATLVVLEGEPECVTLLLGGEPKQGLAFDQLIEACARRGDRLLLYGKAAESIHALCSKNGIEAHRADSFQLAVYGALEKTPAGGTLLFSPGCASFDTHKNFKERALAFRRLLPPADSSNL